MNISNLLQSTPPKKNFPFFKKKNCNIIFLYIILYFTINEKQVTT